MAYQNRRVYIAKRPSGMPSLSDFGIEDETIDQIPAGQVLVKVDTLSMDAWIRTTLDDAGMHEKGDLGSTIRAFGIGQVVASSDPGFAVGDWAYGLLSAQTLALMDAAALTKVVPEQGVSPSDFIGLLGITTDLTAHDGRRDIERALAETGIACVFIEPTVFMDNIIRVWSKPSIVSRGIFAYPAAPGLKISWIGLSDVAEYMAAALETNRADGQHVPVGGPEALTGDEVALRLSAEVGRRIEFRSLDPDDFAANMSELVTGSRELLPGTPYQGMAKFYRFYNTQGESPLVVDPRETAKLLDVEPLRMNVWLKQWDWTKPV